MCGSLFKPGETVKLANGNPTLGTVVHDNEPWKKLRVLDNVILVTWKKAVRDDFGHLVICNYYEPAKLIQAKPKERGTKNGSR